MTRILVVDDDPNLRAAIRRMLEPAGFEIDEAPDGRDAVRTFHARPADLVLCDLFMPEKDGLQILRELPGATVVIMSGGGFGGRIDMLPDALALGAAAVLYKPFGQADLMKVVRQVFPPLPI